MNKVKNYYLASLLLMLSTGCEKEINNINLPEFVSKLVVTSFVSPADSISRIMVTPNQRIYGDLSLYNSMGNLTCYISDGVKEIKLDTAAGGFVFDRSNMKIEYGKTYSVRITSDNGLQAGSKCYVPVSADFNLKVDTFSILHEVPEYHIWREPQVKVTFTDPPETENYYRTIGKWVSYESVPNSTESWVRSEYIWFDQEFPTESSKDVNGDIVNVGAYYNYSSAYSDSAFLNIVLLNTEKSYYLYHKSLQSYSNGDDFFTEPTPVFSNIEGGLGIFTSYTKEVITLRLK